MTTNNPEVVAYLHIDNESPEHRGVSLHHDGSCTSTFISTEPLIRLSDYEDLQDEYEALRAALEDMVNQVERDTAMGLSTVTSGCVETALDVLERQSVEGVDSHG